jgi:Zn-finger nucleic acid-binding protein
MDSMTAALTCPKCHGSMRTYERSGIHLDQCTECRGIFLDRGELDRLLDLEARQTGPVAAPAPVPAPVPAASGNYRESHHGSDYRGEYRGDYRGEYRGDYRKRDGKRRSFLSELFD